jgi:hypothetical protein
VIPGSLSGTSTGPLRFAVVLRHIASALRDCSGEECGEDRVARGDRSHDGVDRACSRATLMSGRVGRVTST